MTGTVNSLAPISTSRKDRGNLSRGRVPTSDRTSKAVDEDICYFGWESDPESAEAPASAWSWVSIYENLMRYPESTIVDLTTAEVPGPSKCEIVSRNVKGRASCRCS